jgi:adenine phosphoribosyltransferase
MADAELKRALVQSLEWVGDRADPSEWWRSPSLFAEITRALAHLHDAEAPMVVAGTQSRGMLLGGAVAFHLGVGFVEIRKDKKADAHGLGLLRRSTPPDYADRDLTLTLRRGAVRPRDRVLLVDDWIATGAQARAARTLVGDAGGSWLGVAAIVDDADAHTRRDLNARALLRLHELN